MDLHRLRLGEWVAGLSGVALVVLLFLPWYETSGVIYGTRGLPGIERELSISGFEAYSVIDVLLVAVAVLGIGLVVLTAMQRTATSGIAADALLTPVALLIAVAALIRVLDLPGDDVSRTVWAWLGVVAAFGIFVGAVRAMRDERLSGSGQSTDATGRRITAPPAIEVIASPDGSGAAG